MNEISEDAFLGGKLILAQPKDGYRAGTDPVLLAAAVTAEPGEAVLELGCGVGVALFCLAARTPGLDLTGVERDAEMAVLARQNAEATGIALRVVQSDLAALPFELRQETFAHVLANPPFFDRERGPSSHGTREAGRGAETPLAVWIDVAIRRLSPSGMLTMIWPATRWPDLARLLDDRVGDVRLKPLSPRAGRAAHLVLVSARKGGRGDARVCPPLILHDGPRHERDGDDTSDEAAAILRDGAALEWG